MRWDFFLLFLNMSYDPIKQIEQFAVSTKYPNLERVYWSFHIRDIYFHQRSTNIADKDRPACFQNGWVIIWYKVLCKNLVVLVWTISDCLWIWNMMSVIFKHKTIFSLDQFSKCLVLAWYPHISIKNLLEYRSSV